MNHKIPMVIFFIIFWTKSFSHIPNENRGKFDANFIKCVFITYYNANISYKVDNLIIHICSSRRHSIFHYYSYVAQKYGDQDLWEHPNKNTSN